MIRYYKDVHQITDLWERMFCLSGQSYFCSARWHKVVLELYADALFTKMVSKIQYFTVSYKSVETVETVGFFTVKRKKGKKVIEFSPLLGPSDYYDFLSASDPGHEQISSVIKQIAADHGAHEVHFAHIKRDSILGQVFKDFPNAEVSTLDCVAIRLPGDYGDYFSSFSKKEKQNIRTAYNRLKKDELEADFRLYDPSHLDTIDFTELKNMFKGRNAHRTEKHIWKTRLLKFLNHPFSEERDMFELQAVKETDFTLGILRLKDQVAAYFFGFERNHKIEINRVVINNDFRFYSPGLLLFNEYIKKEIPNGLETIDLTVGSEKYKYDLEGKTHIILSGKINL